MIGVLLLGLYQGHNHNGKNMETIIMDYIGYTYIYMYIIGFLAESRVWGLGPWI